MCCRSSVDKLQDTTFHLGHSIRKSTLYDTIQWCEVIVRRSVLKSARQFPFYSQYHCFRAPLSFHNSVCNVRTDLNVVPNLIGCTKLYSRDGRFITSRLFMRSSAALAPTIDILIKCAHITTHEQPLRGKL